MTLEFHPGRVDIGTTTGAEGKATGGSLQCSNRVKNCWALLRGFDVQFNNGDHHLKSFKVTVTAAACGRTKNEVQPSGTLLLRDDSGTINDPFHGSIDCLIVAEV